MKNTIIIEIIFLLFVCNINLFSQPDTVKGGFKKCIIYEYEYKFGKINKKSKTKVNSTLYNTKGNIIYKDAYDRSNGSILQNFTYKYDDEGNKIEEIRYYTDDLFIKTTYKYDAVGNKIEEVRYNTDSSISGKLISKYDAGGNKIEEVGYNPDGSIYIKSTLKYNAESKVIEEVRYYADGSICGKLTSKYDEEGNIIEEVRHNSVGKPIILTEYIYSK